MYSWSENTHLMKIKMEIMVHHILRKILSKIHTSPSYTITVDETTDVLKKEQLTLVIRKVDENFYAFEELLGMYNLTRTKAESISQPSWMLSFASRCL